MKIAYFAPTFPPLLSGMGIPCFYTAEKIGATEEVTVFLTRRKNITYQAGNYALRLFKPWFSYGYADFAPQLIWQLKDFDLIHLYYPYYGIAELLPFLKLINLFRGKKNPKIILHYEMDMVGQGITKIISQIHRLLIEPWLFRQADALFILSEDMGQHSKFKKYWQKHRAKIKIVPNGVDTKIFFPQPAINLKKDFTIFTAQALDKAHFFKGIDILLKALRLLIVKDKLALTLNIAGDGNLKEYYQNLAHNLGIQDHVCFLGKLNQKELPSFFSQADLTVVPSTTATECFSTTAAESQACGTPVIVSDWPGVRVTIENNVTGLIIKPNDVNDLKEKIKYLYEHSEILSRMKIASRWRAKNLYDWDKNCILIKQYYRALLK